MITYEVKVPIAFERGLNDTFTNAVNASLDDIRIEWRILLIKQHARLQKVWRPYSTKGHPSYRDRKLKDFESGKIASFDKLERTGRMMDQYISGVRVLKGNYEVRIPFPSVRSKSSGKQYAKIHQSLDYPHHRRFELDEFREMSLSSMQKYIREGLKGFNG